MDLFNQPQSTNADLTALVGCQAHRDIAREAVRKSLVLLKTTAGLLPLSKTAKITLVGPKSQDVGVQCGGWTLGWQGAVGLDPTGSTNIMQGFQSIGGASNISYSADGTGITGDVAVVCIGEVPYAETLGDIVDGTVDNHSLAIPDADFVTNAKNSGKPVVCIMLTGRPMDITGIMTADAIVAAWLPGTEGGGIAEVLYGNYEFSGKLGMAWPANATSEPTENGTGGTPPRFPYDYGLKSNGTQLPGGLY
jgi:beta-glucosidase